MLTFSKCLHEHYITSVCLLLSQDYCLAVTLYLRSMFRRRYASRNRIGYRRRLRRINRFGRYRRRTYSRSYRSTTYRRRFSRRAFAKRRSRFTRRSRYVRRRKDGFQRKVTSALVPWRHFNGRVGQEHTVPAQSAANVIPCIYFTAETYSTTSTKDNIPDIVLFDNSHVVTILDRLWPRIAGTGMLATAAAQSWNTASLRSKVFMQGSMKYTLRCQSSETEYFTAYYCKPRGGVILDSANPLVNVYQYLALGFSQAGLDSSATVPTTNDYFADDDFTPFDSIIFTQSFKIYKVKKFRIKPSEQRTFSIKTPVLSFNPSRLYNIYDVTLTFGTSLFRRNCGSTKLDYS